MPEAFQLELYTDSPDERPVFVAGDFNEWQPADERFQLYRLDAGHYGIVLPEGVEWPRPFEYKYTRGTWADVELTATGDSAPNRRLDDPTGPHRDYVPHWRREGQPFHPQFAPQLVDINGFELPHLGRPRRLRVLLPAGYETNPERRYPVLYLLDAQNLVQGGAGFGDWGLERSLAILKERGRGEFIVVGIDHGEEFRKSEFNPYAHRWLGRGEGEMFVKAVIEGVKPFIDGEFRTRPEREYTGIGGSSLGGLLSYFAGVKAWPVFGKVLVFSPSLWVSPRTFSDAGQLSSAAPSQFYLFGGGRETKSMQSALERLHSALRRHPQVQTHFSFDPEGRHEEARWAREFPKAAEWLFSSEP
jgi:predicted alpha/beta superfamily hydrolase